MKHLRLLSLTLVLVGPLTPGVCAESLWAKRSPAFAALYTDDKARAVGDIVTVIIAESIKSENNEKAELDRESKTDTEVTDFRGFYSKAGKQPFETLPKAGWDSDREFEGEGKYTASSKYEGRLSAVVREVLPNGSLLIEGRREFKIGDDVKTMRLTGIIRPNDILPDNTISSLYVANMKFHDEADGPVSRTRRRGWAGKILAVLWPF